MGFITSIPGTQPITPAQRDPRSIGVGVVGLHEGRTLLLALERCGKAHAVAGCDLSPEKLDASRSERPNLFYTGDYAEMLARSDIGIIAIYTPDAHHGEHIVRAFEAGKDVICTKPLVNSIRDAKAIFQAGQRTGRRLMVGQSTRFFEPFVRQREAFERGDIGTLELVDAHYIHRMDWYYRKSPWVAADTDWIFLGLSHPLDLLRWYLGPITRVQAIGRRSALGEQFGVKGFDVYVVQVEARSGAIGRAMGNYGVHELPRARNCVELMLYGANGSSLAQYHDMRYIHTGTHTPVAEDRARPSASRFNPGGMQEIVEDYLYAGRQYYFNSEVHGMHYGEFANYAEYFADAIINNRPHSPDLNEGIETFCLMEASRRSATERRPVEVVEIIAEIGLPPSSA